MSENPQSAPAQRYTAELAGQIETKWQDRWAGALCGFSLICAFLA